MNPLSAQAVIDVRDMQCAQALAQVAQAMQRLASGAILELLCNADDVQEDVIAWAKQLRHHVLGAEACDGDTWLRIQKR